LRAAFERFERIRERRRTAEELGSGRIGEYSRCRETPSCSSHAASGARMMVPISPIQPSGPASSSSSPKSSENWGRFAIAAIAPATIAAIEETRMSRCLIWPNSCARTILTCSGRQLLQQAVGDCHRRVLRVATGREGVRLLRGISFPSRI
jgi:hypothetical protein